MDENINKEPTQDLETEPKKGFNKTPLLIAALVVLTGLLLIFSISSRRQNDSSVAVREAGTSLTVENQTEADASGKSQVEVLISSGKEKVGGVQLDISYDPSSLTDVDISPGSFFQDPQEIKKIDSEKGTISYILSPKSNSESAQGDGTIAIISFSKQDDKNSEIKFLPSTIVTPLGSSQSVLKVTTSGIVK